LTTDADEAPLKRAIKNHNRKNRNWKAVASSPFYVKHTFVEKQEMNDIVVSIAVQTRRQFIFVKDEKQRFSVVCYGKSLGYVCTEGHDGNISKVCRFNLVNESGKEMWLVVVQ